MDHIQTKSLNRKQTNKQSRCCPLPFTTAKSSTTWMWLLLSLRLILNKSMHCDMFGDLNCEETWKRSQLSTCSTLYSHHCCFGWGGLLLCPVEKCLSSNATLIFSLVAVRVTHFHSEWNTPSDLCSRRNCWKPCFWRPRYWQVFMCVWWRRERQMCRQLDRKIKKAQNTVNPRL